jgi:Fe-S-cluster containining protein
VSEPAPDAVPVAPRRLKVFDPRGRFACASCAHCCSQPWATLIETGKAEALDGHDWSAYPQLHDREFYRKDRNVPDGVRVLSKGEGTKCLFLDHDGLCIIHKELGPAAKPAPCLQFPYLVTHTPVADRVSLNFACPTAQRAEGPTLEEQREELEALLAFPDTPPDPDARVPLTLGVDLTLAEADALYTSVDGILGSQDNAAASNAAATADIWARFGSILRLLSVTAEQAGNDRDGLLDWLQFVEAPAADSLGISAITRYDAPSAAPSPVRLLFAATLLRDILPPDATIQMGLLRRLTMMPRLASIAKFRGSYQSRLLGYRVAPAHVMAHPVGDELEPEAQELLVRYFRTRYWQRSLAGTRLTITAGTHQHIQDLNAIVFLARAIALHRGENRLSGQIVVESLSGIEFAVSNQARAFDQNIMGWFEAQLEEPAIAAQSLRLMCLRHS